MMDRVQIVSSGGTYPAKSVEELTLADVLRINRLPANAYQAYVRGNGAGTMSPTPLTRTVAEATRTGNVILRCIRNPVYENILPQQRSTTRTVDEAVTSIEHVVFGEEGPCEAVVHELAADDARDLVAARVSNFLTSHGRDAPLVVGISGGGDSNTLASSLERFAQSGPPRMRAIAFTLVFEPVWGIPAQDRAAELCVEYGIEHLIIEPHDFPEILSLRRPLEEVFDDFLMRFGMHTRPFFGTFFISKIARVLCQRFGTTDYALGFNREDILTELLFNLMNGRRPLAYPVREFGEFRLLMPLWEVPKRVLDACYPKYSLSNYEERLSGDTVQRSLGYHLADGVEDAYPNLGLSLLEGVRRLFDGRWAELEVDAAADVYVSSYATPEERRGAEEFLAANFVAD